MSLTEPETAILSSIYVASENDPTHPEFPPDHPKFPATPTYQIQVPGFTNVWLKDESYNLTGTHKDRMAWEIVVTYRYFLLAKQAGQIEGELPAMSIISSGSAATAIQTVLRKYKLPNLKVLIDIHVNPDIIKHLKKLGCEIYQIDLGNKIYSWQDILSVTENPDGFDITSSEALDPATRFYDWLSYEILNNSPEYCFMPFGTGTLYENVLNINKKEVSTTNHDPRFQGNLPVLKNCHFLGATTNNPKSKAEKLYSPHLPFVHYDEQWIRLYRYAGFCGSQSNVHVIEEDYLNQALIIAHDQDITCEPSGIAGLALMLQLQKTLPRDKKMLIVNTGKSKVY